MTLVVHHAHALGRIGLITSRYRACSRRIVVALANGAECTFPVHLHVMRKTDPLGIQVLVTVGNGADGILTFTRNIHGTSNVELIV